jgi:hypothetical protein
MIPIPLSRGVLNEKKADQELLNDDKDEESVPAGGSVKMPPANPPQTPQR